MSAPRPPDLVLRGRPVWTLALMILAWVMVRSLSWPTGPASAAGSTTALAATRVPAAGPDAPPGFTPASANALPADLRAGLSPEVADQVARELPRELAHQLAIETAREMAREMAPGLAQRLLRQRGFAELAQRAAREQVPRLVLAHPPGFAPMPGRPRRLAAAAPVDLAQDDQAFRLAPGAPPPVASASASATPAPTPSAKTRSGSLLAMLPELLLHPGRARLAGLAIEPSPRFSADAWVLMRSGMGGNVPLTAGTAGYGGSQSGAVVRYRLFADDPHRTAVFLRASSALALPQREATLGLALRPIARLPVALYGEARLTNDGTGNRLRPAVQAVSEFPPVALPLGLRGELYAAGGYVGGRGATPFYDAQGVIDRKLLGIGKAAELRVGAGAWAGGQKGVGRVDVGPRASVGFRVRRIGLKAAVDYRARVSGSAAPGSGPALTLSAGF